MYVKEITSKLLQSLEKKYDKAEACNIASLLLEKKLGEPSIAKLLECTDTVTASTLQNIYDDIAALENNKPIQYILKQAWFYKFPFYVNENVLIPRPETEELVELCLKKIKQEQLTNPTILEVGTGSGCIAISIKKELPTATVTAIDISNEALEVAKKNASSIQTSITFLEVDFLDESQWRLLPNIDVIVSNPPYIPMQEKNTMQKNVLEFEPHLALFVPDATPLLFYEKLGKFALQRNAMLCCEISEHQAENILDLFKSLGFTIVEIITDLQGKNRMVFAKYNQLPN